MIEEPTIYEAVVDEIDQDLVYVRIFNTHNPQADVHQMGIKHSKLPFFAELEEGSVFLIKFYEKRYELEYNPKMIAQEDLSKAEKEVPKISKMLGTAIAVNIKTDEFDVYIGRENKYYNQESSKWANPFTLNSESEREIVVKKYLEYVLERNDLLNCLEELDGQRLGCYCKPKLCHGDILIALLNKKICGKLEQFKKEYEASNKGDRRILVFSLIAKEKDIFDE